MSMRDDRTSLLDMPAHAREALELPGDRSREALSQDRVLQLALTRLVEVIGEAAGRVSEQPRHKTVGIPWPPIIGMRNRLIHGYDVIDYDLLWDTVRNDLPALALALDQAVEEA